MDEFKAIERASLLIVNFTEFPRALELMWETDAGTPIHRKSWEPLFMDNPFDPEQALDIVRPRFLRLARERITYPWVS